MIRVKNLVLMLVALALVLIVTTKVGAEQSGGLSAVPLEVQRVPAPVVQAKGVSGPEIYIVQLSEPPLTLYEGGVAGLAATAINVTGQTKLDASSPAALAYLEHLDATQARFVAAAAGELGRQIDVSFNYRAALNGVAFAMTPEEANRVAALPGVQRIWRDQWMPLDTDAGPAWIGAPGVWDGSAYGGVGTFGEGIIVGVLDSGINMDHPSFADIGADGYDHENPYGSGNYVGWCDPGNPNYDPIYVCNDKLIGAWDYADAFGDPPIGPEDDDGHGSHTASTAAGNFVMADGPTGPVMISGVAPHANVIAYDVCVGGSCPESATVAGIDQSVLDGVDVLNESISIGGDTFLGAKQQAYLGAVSAGIFSSRSAGNSGPDPATVGPEPVWSSSTAATTHNRAYETSTDITGPTPVPPNLEDIPTQPGGGIILPVGGVSGEIRYSGVVDPANVEGCVPFPANAFDGTIALISRGSCAFTVKETNAANAGAIAMIVHNNAGDGLVSMLVNGIIPSAFVGQTDGENMAAFIAANPGATALISTERIVDDALGDYVASFSSRGPGPVNAIKPDTGAPGVSILAAVADGSTTPSPDAEFGLNSGTSMASPHNAGAAALIRALNPSWSPAQVRSALMTTSVTDLLDQATNGPAGIFDYGAGRVDLSAAANAGLILDVTGAEWAAADATNVAELNLASMANAACVGGTCTWTRTVEATVDGTWYAYDEGEFPVTIDPAMFTLAAGETQELTITADASGQPANAWTFAEVILSPNPPTTARVPLPKAATGAPERFDDRLGCAYYDNYAGAEPVGYAAACLGVVSSAIGAGSIQDPTDDGFAHDIGFISDNMVTYTLNDFPNQAVFGASSAARYGYDFDPTGSILYAIDNGTRQLGVINQANGSFTAVATINGDDGSTLTGLSIDPTDGTFYLSNAANLYTLDPGSGAATLVGAFGGGVTMIDIAVGPDGSMYGHDIVTDAIYSINKATGVATLVGPTGYAANFAQGMDFDNNDGTLYIFLYIGGGANVYGTVNLATGAVTPLATDNPLGEFEGATKTGSGDLAAIAIEKTVGTEPGVCASESLLSVAAGTVVYYCYAVTNLGNVTLTTHTLIDDQLGAIFTDLAYDLAPGESLDTVAAGLVVTATITANTTTTAEWTAYVPDGLSANATASATVLVPVALSCDSGPEMFESGLPLSVGWVEAHTGNVFWDTTANLDACDNGGNQTPGSGEAACADSDETNVSGDPYDAQLWTNPFDLPADATVVTLDLAAAYNDINTGLAEDFFEIDISMDAGSTWTNLLSWNEDHYNPGEFVSLDLSAYAGMSGLIVRFHYFNTDGGWDWWAQVDDVTLSCQGGAPDAHLPVAVIPVIGEVPELVEIQTRRDAGSWLVPDITAVEITDLTVDVLGLQVADTFEDSIFEDNNPGAPFPDIFFDDLDGAFWMTYDVPADTHTFIVEILETTSPDLDMAVGYDSNNDGLPSADELVCQSAAGGSFEYCEEMNPTPGTWWFVIINFEASAPGASDFVKVALAAVPNADNGNMTVEGPTSVPPGVPFDLRVFWDEPALEPGGAAYGAFSLGTDPGNPGNLGTVPVHLYRLEDDVSKVVSNDAPALGETLTYTITIQPNVNPEDFTYYITDTIPAGLTYVPGSASASEGTVSVSGNVLSYTGVAVAGGGPILQEWTSPFGYLSLAGLGVTPFGCPSDCDEGGWIINVSNPWSHFGVDYTQTIMSVNGALEAGTDSGVSAPWANVALPDPAAPNNLLAPFWSDLDMTASGELYAASLTDGANFWSVFEWEDAPQWSNPSATATFQIWQSVETGDTWYTYGGFAGAWPAATVGYENADGTVGTTYHYDGTGPFPQPGVDLLFAEALAEPITITYQATVDEDACGTVSNQVLHNTDNPGSLEASTAVDVTLPPCGLPRILYRTFMNDGSSETGVFTLQLDGTFADLDGDGGTWNYRSSPPRVRLQYTDGSNCDAFSFGFITNTGRVYGFRACRDGSGVEGQWFGQVLARSNGPTGLPSFDPALLESGR